MLPLKMKLLQPKLIIAFQSEQRMNIDSFYRNDKILKAVYDIHLVDRAVKIIC